MFSQPFGLGDLAYYLFRPAVYAIDFIWSSDMRHCEVCKKRRALWNSWFSLPRWAWSFFLLTILAMWVWWRCES